MSNLLQVVRMKPKILQDQAKTAVPVMVEFKVDPQTAPFLVSSSTGLVWIEGAHPGDVVKAAVRRKVAVGDLFLEVANAIRQRSQQDQWGNAHQFSQRGLSGAIEHVQSYDMDDLEILVPRLREDAEGRKGYERPEWLHPQVFKMPLRPTSWLPDDCAVVVPRDREFVGMLGHLDARTSIVLCVHNASRGMAFAWGAP